MNRNLTTLILGLILMMPVVASAADPIRGDCKGKPDGASCRITISPGETAEGSCIKQVCKGTGYTDENGIMKSFGQGLGQALGQMLPSLLQKLMQGDGGAGSGSAAPVTPVTAPTIVCPSGTFLLGSDCVPITSTVTTSTTSLGTDGSGGTGGTGSTCNVLDSIFGSCGGSGGTGGVGGTGGTGGMGATDLIDTGPQGSTSTNPDSTSGDLETIAGSGNTSATTTKKKIEINGDAGDSFDGTVTEVGTGTGVTIKIKGGDSDVVGFYGSNTFGAGQSTTVLGKLCAARPWATGLISSIIPSKFFDNLCLSRGLTPGQTAVTTPAKRTQVINVNQAEHGVTQAAATSSPQGLIVLSKKGMLCSPSIIDKGMSAMLAYSCGTSELTQATGFSPGKPGVGYKVSPRQSQIYSIACKDNFTAQCSVTVVNPQLSIWADPPQVKLGTRATILWNAKDVTDCIVSGPSFSEKGIKGGASTVPIYDAAKFTLSCVSPSGATTTRAVMVNLGL